jgi:membrane protease YdiL (CAAX protease family)
MAQSTPAQLALALLSAILLAALAAILFSWAWIFRRLATGGALLPPKPILGLPNPPWKGGTVFLVFATTVLLYAIVGTVYVHAMGRALPRAAAKAKPALKAAETGAPSAGGDRIPVPKTQSKSNGPGLSHIDKPRGTSATRSKGVDQVEPKTAAPREQAETLTMVEKMLVVAMVNGLLILVVPPLVRMTSNARLRDLGLSFDGWRQQAAIGVVATLAAAPVVYAIQYEAIRIWRPRDHPLQQMLRDEFGLGVADLAVLSAVILAPIAEELMFRAILQRWLIDVLERRAAARQLHAELQNARIASIAKAHHWPEFEAVEGPKDDTFPAETSVLPRSRRSAVVGIGLTSLLFAAVHSDQWPAPIPLFVLAFGIGSIFQRTGSLIAAIFMHATFNGLSTLVMFLALLGGDEREVKKMAVGGWRNLVSIEERHPAGSSTPASGSSFRARI